MGFSTSPGKGKESSKHIEILYVDRPQFATLLLPPSSTGFYPDGILPGKNLENSGKQNPKMGSSFVTLKDWKNRTAADQKLPAIVGRALTAFARFKEALPWFLRRLR
jgi:hypothetical protein